MMSLVLRPKNDDDDELEADKKALMFNDNPDAIRIALPPLGIDPKLFVEHHFGKHTSHMRQFQHGTTTLAFVYAPKTTNDKGGIIVAVDSRASAGQYISSKTVMKIISVTDKIVATMAGGAADCQYWTRVLAKYCAMFELREQHEITVAAASKYLSNILYNYRGMGLSIGTMIAGFDKRGASIYRLDDGGDRQPITRLCSIGSGSLYAYSVLDQFYCAEMTDEEARDLGRRAIVHATYRDAGSGGSCNMIHITPTEKIVFPRIDVSDAMQEHLNVMGREAYMPVDSD